MLSVKWSRVFKIKSKQQNWYQQRLRERHLCFIQPKTILLISRENIKVKIHQHFSIPDFQIFRLRKQNNHNCHIERRCTLRSFQEKKKHHSCSLHAEVSARNNYIKGSFGSHISYVKIVTVYVVINNEEIAFLSLNSLISTFPEHIFLFHIPCCIK